MDLNQVYQQLVLDEESQKLVVINTHKGLRTYNRLCFGVASAPGILKREIESVLCVDGVQVIHDDILIVSKSLSDHNIKLSKALEILRKYGFTVKPEKCKFGVKLVEFLGYVISDKGITTSEKRVSACKHSTTSECKGTAIVYWTN